MAIDIRTTCNRDCPDSCSIIATVEGGRIVKHRGDPAHGVTRGFLCSRGNRYLRRFYHPDRLLYPQVRTEGGWKRVDWDEALHLVASRLRDAREAPGPTSVLVVNYSGIHTQLASLMGRLFWSHFGGGTFVRGGLSVEAVLAAHHLDFGGSCCHEPEDLVNARALVVWGKNLAVTRQHWIPFLDQARKAGAPVVVIDPLRCATAQRANHHLQLRPGSDGMLAIGIARILIERGDLDQQFVADHTHNFEKYRALVLSTPLARVLHDTSLTLEQIELVADIYAKHKPTCTLVGLGPSYWRAGGATVRLIDALAAITGNVGVPGGGVGSDIVADRGLDLRALDAAPKGTRRTVLLPRLGADILGASDPPLKVGFVAGANPVATAPDSHAVERGLKSLETLIVVDQFMSATAQLAHIVLPCTTYLEADDLVTAYGHHWLGVTRRVVPPLGQCRSDVEILQGLAERLGFGEALAGTPDEWLNRMLAPLKGKGITLESLRECPQKHPDSVAVPFVDHRFKTPSGKVELITAFESTAFDPSQLRLVATKTLPMVNSQIDDEDRPDEPVIRMHPESAAAHHLADGAAVRVSSAAGELNAILATDTALRKDVVVVNPAQWRGDLKGVNQLRAAHITDIGEGAAMHETVVTVGLR